MDRLTGRAGKTTTSPFGRIDQPRVWKVPGDGGAAFPVARDILGLRAVVPDCALCSRAKGLARPADRVSWWAKGPSYTVAVFCHGQVERRTILRSELEGATRVVVHPAFLPAPSAIVRLPYQGPAVAIISCVIRAAIAAPR